MTKKTITSRKTLNKTGEQPCQLCGTRTMLQTHHIEGRKILNANHYSNLVSICPNCHFQVHWGEIIIEKWVMTSKGMHLFWHKKGEDSFTGNDSTTHVIGH